MAPSERETERKCKQTNARRPALSSPKEVITMLNKTDITRSKTYDRELIVSVPDYCLTFTFRYETRRSYTK